MHFFGLCVFPTVHSVPPPSAPAKCKNGKARSMQASPFSDEESMSRKGQLWPAFDQPRVPAWR